MLLVLATKIVVTLRSRLDPDEGFSTAELLANAALGVGALVLIWGAMNALSVDVMAWIRSQLNIG